MAKRGCNSLLRSPAPLLLDHGHCSPSHAGAELREWYLGGTSTGDIQLQSSAGLATAASTTPSGGMAAVFTAGPSQGSVPLIFAAGGVYNDGSMRCACWLALRGNRGGVQARVLCTADAQAAP